MKHIDRTVERIVRMAKEKIPLESDTDIHDYIPTGSTLLNLACSDKAFGGFGTGKIVNLVGDSSSGKTFLALTVFAEMASKSKYDKYIFIYDDVEQACAFNMKKLFGSKAADRVLPPAVDKDKEPIYSETIQDFQYHVMKFLEKGKPFIYVLDSFDALTSKEEQAKTEDMMKAHEKNSEVKGSYGMTNPKVMSSILRQIKGKIKRTDSLLIVISQTRDNINPMSFEKKTRSGGRALKFYSSHEMWTATGGKIKHKGTMVGVICKIKITKNKLTGKIREVEFPIYYEYGVDDIGSCIDFLVANGTWREKGRKIICKGLHFKGTRDALIKYIENKHLEKKLKKLVSKTWRGIEEGLSINRKAKYQ